MPFDLAALTRNKPALYGVGAVAAIGGFVWYRRRQANAATGASTTTTGGTQTQAGTAAYDSTGTDLRAAIGDLGAGLQQQLLDYTNQLQASQGAGAIAPTTPSPTPTRKHYNVVKGDTLASISQGNNVPISKIRTLNSKLSAWDYKRPLPVGYGLWLS
jgi:LysM repeat protein